jgi:MFS family permease
MAYPVGSISKQFTATAVLLLQEKGKISIDDPVGKYFPELTRAADVKLRNSTAFFFLNSLAIVGNFFSGYLSTLIGNRKAIMVMFVGMFLAIAGGFAVPRTFAELAWFWLPMVGFFSGVFGLFTMYLPPLFPTLLRTSGAGFCYNIGRVAAAAASLIFGWLAPVGDYRVALLAASVLLLAAAIWTIWLPADAE